MKTKVIGLGKSETIKGYRYKKEISDNTIIEISEKEYLSELEKMKKIK